MTDKKAPARKPAAKKPAAKAVETSGDVFEFYPHGEKIHVHLNGVLIHRAGSMSAAHETVRKRSPGMTNPVVKLHGGLTEQHALGGVPMTAPPPRFTVAERISFLRTNVRLVAKGHSHSMLCMGEGGLGKTWNTMEVLRESGLRDIRKTYAEKEVGYRINMSQHYRFVKGTGSAKGLFRLLYENNGGLLVLDDCDDLLKDKTGINILKTALDTLEDRWITWAAEEPVGGTDLPREFEYVGRIIFLSNEAPEKISQALKTRALRVDMSMTRDEIVEYMEDYMLPSETFLPETAMKVKKEALKLIKDIKDTIPMKAFSARALIHACNIFQSGEENWRDIATFNLTSKA